MANALGEDLTGRYVVLKEECMAAPYKALEHRIFKVEGGFGAVPYTSGQAIFGTFPIDEDQARMEGFMVERYATDDEVALVVKT